MKKKLYGVCIATLLFAGVTPMKAQFNIGKAAGGAVKAAKAITLSDADMAKLCKRIHSLDGQEQQGL